MTGAGGAAINISLSANGILPLQVHGPIRLTSLSAAGESANISLSGVVSEAPVSIAGGAGADALRTENCGILRSFTASLGAGADLFALEAFANAGSSTFSGPVRLQGGAGDDTFQIGGATAATAIDFRSAVTLDGGAGADVLTTGSEVIFDLSGQPVMLNFP